LRAGGLGNFVGGFVAAFVFAEIISLGDCSPTWNGVTCCVRLLHRHDVHQARRADGEALVNPRQLVPWIAGGGT